MSWSQLSGLLDVGTAIAEALRFNVGAFVAESTMALLAAQIRLVGIRKAIV